jgi:phospholipid transport system substrate-binding protein
MLHASIARARAALGLICAAAALAIVASAPAHAQEAPDALVRRVSGEIIGVIKSDPQVQAGNQARIREVIETRLLQYFDFNRMTAIAMGKNWRTATPEQQQRLTDEFRTLLVRTYSGALNQYRNETIETKPARLNPGDTEVTVRTLVIRPSREPEQIDYSMESTPQGWKAYDVIVGGVSLVTNYREEFNGQVKAGGIDGLIGTLAAKNKGPAPK